MRFSVFRFFAKFPLVGILASLLLACYTGPKAFNEARYEGFLPLETIKAEVVDAFTKEGRGRRGASRTYCFAKVQTEELGTSEVQIDCDEFAQIETGSTIEVVKEGEGLESLSINKGSFYIDLVLLIAELAGAFYYFRLLKRKN